MWDCSRRCPVAPRTAHCHRTVIKRHCFCEWCGVELTELSWTSPCWFHVLGFEHFWIPRAMFQTLAWALEAIGVASCACNMPRRNWAGFHAPWKWKIHHQPNNSSWMNYFMCLTNHGVPHVFAQRPVATNLNAQAPGLDPALFASGLALCTKNRANRR